MWKVLLGLALVAALAIGLLLWARGQRRRSAPTTGARAGVSVPPGDRPRPAGGHRRQRPSPRPEPRAWAVEIPGGEAPIGVPGCDAYIRLYVCYLKAAPPSRRRAAYDAFRTAVIALRLGVKESTAPRERRQFVESCDLMYSTFRKAVAHYDYARHCLKEP